MKRILFFAVLVSIFVMGCKSENGNEKVADQDEKDARIEQKETTDFLQIEGENIWVRETPATGDVVMKLNTGDKCQVLEKGKEETIRGVTDYWYKIEFEGDTGWVFGSQTTKKQSDAEFEEIKTASQEAQEQKDQIIAFIKEIVDIYKKNDFNRLKDLYYLDYKTFYIDNPGMFIVINLTGEDKYFEKRKVGSTSQYPPKFESWPSFNMEKEGWTKNGWFIEEVSDQNIFSRVYDTMEKYDLKTDPEDKKIAQDIGKKTEYKILYTESPMRFYIAKKDGKWKITGIGTWDSSS